MARSMDIFVETDLPLAEFVSRLEALLGMTFERTDDDFGPRYEAVTPKQHLIVFEHDLVNDRDLDFESYDHQISIWAVGAANWRERLRVQEELARQLMDTLRKTGEFRLMLVDDIQVKMEEFTPEQR